MGRHDRGSYRTRQSTRKYSIDNDNAIDNAIDNANVNVNDNESDSHNDRDLIVILKMTI